MPNTATRTVYALIAYLLRENGEQVPAVIARYTSEEAADLGFTRACLAADEHRLYVFTPETGFVQARNVFSVREAGHVEVNEAKFGTAVVVRAGRGFRDRIDAVGVWGRSHGYVGNFGGWIYRESDTRRRRPVGQGWYVLNVDENRKPREARVISANGRYLVVEDLFA